MPTFITETEKSLQQARRRAVDALRTAHKRLSETDEEFQNDITPRAQQEDEALERAVGYVAVYVLELMAVAASAKGM